MRTVVVVSCEGCAVRLERVSLRRSRFVLCSVCAMRWLRERRRGALRPSRRPFTPDPTLPPCATCGGVIDRPHRPQAGSPRCIVCRERERLAQRRPGLRAKAAARRAQHRATRGAPAVLARILGQAHQDRAAADTVAWLRRRYGSPSRSALAVALAQETFLVEIGRRRAAPRAVSPGRNAASAGANVLR